MVPGQAGRLPLAHDWSLASAYHTRDWAQRVQNKILVELKGRGTVGERNLFRRGTWVATWLPQTLAGAWALVGMVGVQHHSMT